MTDYNIYYRMSRKKIRELTERSIDIQKKRRLEIKTYYQILLKAFNIFRSTAKDLSKCLEDQNSERREKISSVKMFLTNVMLAI